MTGSDDKRRRTATEITHAGHKPYEHHGFVNPPVYRGSTELFKTLDSFEKCEQRYVSQRRGTPTSEAHEEAIATLEGGVRLHIELEDVAGLKADLEAGFARLGAPAS